MTRCSCANFTICDCEAWNHPSSIDGCFVHSESCPLYYGGDDHNG